MDAEEKDLQESGAHATGREGPGGNTHLPVVLLSGPTASGKTGASIALARTLNAEIISVDSGIVYRGLDIGTAKPTMAEREGVPHHLIDVRDPWEAYSAAAFVEDTLRLIHEIRGRGRRVLLVGGTLLYVRALEQGLAPLPPADPEVRAELLARAKAEGWQALHAELAVVDPVAAARIHPNDPQRLQRALEVYRVTGTPLGELQRNTTPAFKERLIKLAMVPESRPWLHARIVRRFEEMVANGFLDEVRKLREDPRLHAELPAIRSVGYRQAWQALEAADAQESGVDPEWITRAVAATRQLAKRQLTWLRGMESLHRIPCDTLDDVARDEALLKAVQSGSV